MRLPWRFDWSPLNLSGSIRRRNRHNSVGESNNESDLSGSYLSHSEDHYVKNLVYATLLKSKAKLEAAKIRLKRSREEDEFDSSCPDIDHDNLHHSQSVIGRRFRSLRRLKKFSMPRKDLKRNDFSNTTSNETLDVFSLDMSLDETCTDYSPEPHVIVSSLPSSPKRRKLGAGSIPTTPLSSKCVTSTPSASTPITCTPRGISPIPPCEDGYMTPPESPISIRKHSYKVATANESSRYKYIPLKLLQNSPQLQRSHSKTDCTTEDSCENNLKDELTYSPRECSSSPKGTRHKKETFRSPVKHARHQAAHVKDSGHLDAFEYYRAEDEREWARRFEEVHVDTKSASSMFKLLQSKLQYSAAYPHFLSLMHHLLLLPNDLGSPDPWILFDRVLQQLVTQAEDGTDREVKLLDINVNTIVKLIANERELTESRAKIMRLESDFADVVTDLNRKEQELYSQQQEKDELSLTLTQVRGQMELEHNNSAEAQQKNSELETSIIKLTAQIQQLAAGSLSDDVKATLASTPIIQESISKSAPPPPPPPPMMNGGPPPPPPPPMMNGGPPPPPPPGPGRGPPPPPLGKLNRPPKQIPKSATTLRAFNWNKMPEARVNGTIFATLDETSLYKFMDLEDIDRAFDAAAGKKSTFEGERTIERLSRQKTQQISVIEGRRQQNCTILLSKLKMSNDELIRVLLKMDSDYEISPDMVEQLLKFTPTAEEKSMLEEHVDELDQLARADRFLYDISKIEHYEERLQCLLYQKKFKERLAECEPRTLAVIHASKELQNSKRLKKLMEVVLAFGNYMNKGARGGACGFRISSLNKLTDTKSSNNRQITLLHYIIGVCEKQWKEVLKLEDDFPHAKDASRVNITELEKDILQLRQGLDYIEREVNWHRGQGTTPPGDRFRLVMNEFTALAKDKFTHNECQFKNMKAQFERVVVLYGEDPKTAQPEDFFGTFDSFCDSFKDAKNDLDNMRKKEEEEERKRKEAERREAERERRARERKASMTALNGGQTSGDSSSGGENENDFDDLISALRSGDVFGKDIDKMRRKKKHSFSGASRERERIVGSHKYA